MIRWVASQLSWATVGVLVVFVLTVIGASLALLSASGDVTDRVWSLALLVSAGLLALVILFIRAGRSAQGGLSLTAGPAAPWSPIFASLATLIALFLLREPELDAGRRAAVLIGVGLGAMSWIVAIWSMTFRSKPENVNPRVYADLLEKQRAVSTRLERFRASHPGNEAVIEADQHFAWASGELRIGGTPTQPGVDWATGFAYINVWTSLHRAEEALLRMATRPELAEVMLYDRLRTWGSRLISLRAKVRASHAELARVTNPGQLTPDEAEGLLRTEVAAVRQAINEFRDSRWDGLARARNRLNYTTLITAWTAFLVLVVAIGLRAPVEAIAAGSVFFLVGALIGLFSQLRSDAGAEEAVEDFGMAAARLRQTLIASGLAAVGGVVITALAADATAATRSTSPPNLATVFSVGANPAQLLVAAIFGLSPHLLIERLTASADRYRADLKQTGTGDADVKAPDVVTDEGEP